MARASRVFLGRDGFLYYEQVGDQNRETIESMLGQIATLGAQLRAEGRPVLSLIDLTKLGKQDTGARWAASQGLKDLDYDRVAVFSSDPYMRYITNLVARASGNFDKIRFFSTKAEAVAFLSNEAKTLG